MSPPGEQKMTEQTTAEKETPVDQTSRSVVEEGDDNEDESHYPRALPFALITIALCLSVFCMALDNTIIAVSRAVYRSVWSASHTV